MLMVRRFLTLSLTICAALGLSMGAARPMIFNYRLGTCRSRAVHAITIMVNSLFNGWRFEDAWLGQ